MSIKYVSTNIDEQCQLKHKNDFLSTKFAVTTE